MQKFYSKRAKWVNCYLRLLLFASRLIRYIKVSYFLCYDATVNIFEHLQDNEGKRIRQNGKSRNKSEHRGCVLIIIIGYRRLVSSIFDVQVCDLDIVLKCKTLKCRLRRSQRKDDKDDRHSHPDAVEAQKALILPRNRMFL